MDDNAKAEDRRKHLEFIQAAILRMSQASSQVKTWMLPVVTAAYAYAVINHSWEIALLGVLVTFPALFMDCRYLRTERNYRELYKKVAQPESDIPVFSMDCGAAILASGCGCRGLSVLKSWSIWPFYLSIILIGLLALFFAVIGN